MTRYIVESSKVERYEKNYMLLMINIVPAMIWSIPVYQMFSPKMNGKAVFGLCVLFIIAYVVIGMSPFISLIPDVASVIIAVLMLWSPVELIGNDVTRIIIKVIVAAFCGMVGLTLFINATLPWLQKKTDPGPRVRRIED